MSIAISIIAVLIMLGILTAAHELGHFFVAKLLKVKAFEVSIFVGPALLKWKKKNVDYSIRAIPLGAYVRFTDIDSDGNPVESDDPDLLINQPRWKRLLIALAGPLVNLLLGILIFAIFYSFTGYVTLTVDAAPEGSQLYGQQYEVGDTVVAVDGYRVFTEDEMSIYSTFIKEDQPCVLTFKSEKTGDNYDVTLTPVKKRQALLGITRLIDIDPTYHGWTLIKIEDEQNGGNPVLKVDDILMTIDGHKTEDIDDTVAYLDSCVEGQVVTVEYIRDGESATAEIKLYGKDVYNSRGVVLNAYSVDGIKTFFGAVGTAFKMPLSIVRLSGLIIKNAFSGDVKIYQVISGPVGVVNAVDTVVANENVDTGIKFSSLVMLSGMVSVALTISNMLPLPGLDGSQLIITLIEMVIGRRLSKKAENVIAVIGFFVLILLVIMAFASDIAKIFIEGW